MTNVSPQQQPSEVSWFLVWCFKPLDQTGSINLISSLALERLWELVAADTWRALTYLPLYVQCTVWFHQKPRINCILIRLESNYTCICLFVLASSFVGRRHSAAGVQLDWKGMFVAATLTCYPSIIEPAKCYTNIWFAASLGNPSPAVNAMTIKAAVIIHCVKGTLRKWGWDGMDFSDFVFLLLPQISPAGGKASSVTLLHGSWSLGGIECCFFQMASLES